MEWYYSENNQQKGPVSEAALSELASAGVVQDSTLVWHSGLTEWQPYRTVRPGTAAPISGATFCSECGRQFDAEELVPIGTRVVCAECKQNVLQRIREGGTTVSGRIYAGFWIRAAAMIIDAVLLSSVNVAFSLFLFVPATRSQDPTRIFSGLLGYSLISMVIAVAYECGFLVKKGATPGKLVLGLRVIRDNGGPITWGLAIGRYFGKIVSQLALCIGFLMVAWDEQKRSLHDRLCDTRVVRK